MADLTGGGDGRDRGQLLLVTGFAIAVAIVVLVLLLNTAIYAENLATRDVDTGADDALAYRDAVGDGLWPVVAFENEREHASRSTVRGNVTDRIDQFIMLAGQRHLEGGASANLTDRTLHDGTLLRQNESRHVNDSSGARNWTMATDAGDVRAFEMNATGGLRSTGSPGDEAFNVTVTGSSGDEWSVYVYEHLGDAEVAVKNGSETSPELDVCSGLLPSNDPPRVNLTAGAINGGDCEKLVFAKDVDPPYEISVTYGDRVDATYNATVNTTQTFGFNGPGPASPPYEVPVVYSLSTDVVYRTADLEYRVRVRIAPEADG